MCGHCGRPLNPNLIDDLRTELATDAAASGTGGNSGTVALVDPGAVEASGGWNLQAEGISFQNNEAAPNTNAWGGEDTFVFHATGRDSDSNTSTNWIEIGLSDGSNSDSPLMSWQVSGAEEAEFWTYNLESLLEDWHF